MANEKIVDSQFQNIIYYLPYLKFDSEEMNVKGKHILDEEVSKIWPLLQDQDVLARIAPGISSIEKVSEDNFKVISEISIGPVRGSFEGALNLTDKVENETMTMVLEQKSKIGNAQASILMNLVGQENRKTLITYEGKAKVSGRLATMGQRILGGVISTLSKQVFKELEVIVDERKAEVSSPLSSGDTIAKTEHATLLSSKNDQTSREPLSENLSNPAAGDKNNKSIIQTIIDKILSIWR